MLLLRFIFGFFNDRTLGKGGRVVAWSSRRGRLASLPTLHGGACRDPSMGEGAGGDGRERRRSRHIHIPLQREAPLRVGEERKDVPDELSIMERHEPRAKG